MTQARWHLFAMAVWGFLLIPSITVWKESLIWVIIMSWYANFVGHYNSYQSARAEEQTCKLEKKIDNKSDPLTDTSTSGRISI